MPTDPSRRLSRSRRHPFAWRSCILLVCGCHVQPPGGAVISPPTLGAGVDAANQLQEANAEAAKRIVYSHEFESNQPVQTSLPSQVSSADESFRYQPIATNRGFRLTPAGQDHVRQLALMLLNSPHPSASTVIVERSQTSKSWDTEHRYPIHFNEELDEIRRRVVVATLVEFGVADADSMVIVAPAFPTGLSGMEAAAAYEQGMSGVSTSRRQFGFQ